MDEVAPREGDAMDLIPVALHVWESIREVVAATQVGIMHAKTYTI